MVFIFGSNEAGISGAGAALYAVKHHGAVMGKGYGRQGNSFAIPTKDKKLKTLDPMMIKSYVDFFIAYAITKHREEFKVTRIGCRPGGIRRRGHHPHVLRHPRQLPVRQGVGAAAAGKAFLGNILSRRNYA